MGGAPLNLLQRLGESAKMLPGKDASAGAQNIAECRLIAEVKNGIQKRIISLYYSIIRMLQAKIGSWPESNDMFCSFSTLC